MLNFRKAEQKDILQIAELDKNIFTDPWSEQGLLDTYSQKQSFLTIAEVGGQIVAYCILYYVLEEGEIARIAVDNAYRRQGVGRGLMEYTCQVCLEMQVERLLLDVRESNVAAQKFYQSYGFEMDGMRKNFYQTPTEDAVLMSKILV